MVQTDSVQIGSDRETRCRQTRSRIQTHRIDRQALNKES